MNINDIVKEAHENAVNHGWWDEQRPISEQIALMHSELSEALEEMRAGNRIRPGQPVPMVYYSGSGYLASAPTEVCQKPEGVAVELADAVIRIADICGHLGIDLESVIREKMAYNKNRPYRHGGKKF